MKRRLFLATMALALSASAAFADTDLHFWSWSPPEKVLNEIAKGFEARNPGVHVIVHSMESRAYQDRMPLALQSGDPMDVVAVQTSTMVETVKDNLTPLPELFEKANGAKLEDTLNAKALAQARLLASDGQLYIAPLGTLGSPIIYYNGELMDKLGLKVPANREELASFVADVKKKQPDFLPISFTGAGWFLDEITNAIAEQGSPGWFNSVRYDKGGTFNGPEYTRAFDAMIELYKDGIFSKDTLDLDYTRAASLFQEGKAVAFIQGSWENGYLSAPYRADNGIKLTDVGASAFPVVVAGGKPAARAFIEVGLAVPKASRNQELAAQFINYMIAGEGMKPWVKSLFVIPAKQGFEVDPSLFSTPRAAEGFKAVAEILANAPSDRNNVSDFSNVVGDALTAAIVKGTPTRQQVDFLQSEWTSGRYSNAK